MPEPDPILYCAFCGKRQSEVLCLIAAPTAFICDECVIICADIVADRYERMNDALAHYWGA